MRLETGSNPNPGSKKMSIQLALDGHSFCGREQAEQSVGTLQAEALNALKAAGVTLAAGQVLDVEFRLLTSRTILAPKQILDQDCTSEELQQLCTGLLAASGMLIKAGERAIMSLPHGDMVAIMAINCQLDDALNAITRANYTTPLLTEHELSKPTVWVEQIEGLMYIKVYASTLMFSEVVSARSKDEIVYLFEMLSREFAPRNHELIIAGREPKKLKKLIGGGYAKVICNKK